LGSILLLIINYHQAAAYKECSAKSKVCVCLHVETRAHWLQDGVRDVFTAAATLALQAKSKKKGGCMLL
jgi:hypothetical protein